MPLYEDRILQIVPSSFDKQDVLCWLPNASGDYTSKSCYATARESAHNRVLEDFPWRKCVWNLNTPPKVKTFLWRATNGALPVGSVLLTRGLHAEASCKRCGELETPLHLFLTCPFAARVWDLIPALFKPEIDTTSSVRELLLSNTRIVNLPPTGLANSQIYPWLYWHLWKARNKFIFEDRSWIEKELVVKVLKDARSWEEASQGTKRSQAHVARSSRTLPQLPAGTFCFTDGAWDPSSGNSGQGWRFTTSSSVELKHQSSNRRHVAAPIVAEALAVKAALLDAVANDFLQLNVFSDSKSLINLLNSSASTVLLHSVLFDIRVLCGRFESISFSFVPRLGNVVADSLAKSALKRLVTSPVGE